MRLPLLDSAAVIAAAPQAPAWVQRVAADIAQLPPPLVDVSRIETQVSAYRWLLDRCGDEGLELTATGRFRSADLASLAENQGWPCAPRREQSLPAATTLRESAVAMRLVAQSGRRLRVTPAGRAVTGDPMALWHHIVASLPLEVDELTVFVQAARFMWALADPPHGTTAPDAVAAAVGACVERGDGSSFSAEHLLSLGRTTWAVADLLVDDADDVRFFAQAVFRHQLGLVQPIAPAPAEHRTTVPCHTVKMSLRGVRPPVWRRVRIPSGTRLPDVAEILLAAMGWAGYHLWAFRSGRTSYLLPDPDWPGTDRDARDVTLADLLPATGARAVFEYDFGDDWEHDILVESIAAGPAAPTVLAGRRACPPEDVGGPWGYRDFLAAIADPAHPAHTDLLRTAGGAFDPEAFDVQACDEAVRLW